MSKNNKTRMQRNNRSKKKDSKIKKFFKVIFSLIAILIIFGAGLFTYYASSAPSISQSVLSSDNSTKIYDSKGRLISRLGAQNRDYISSEDIPDGLKQAIVSTEDRTFYKNHGISPKRIIGAAFSNLTGSSLGLQGGSTLTQQLVKLSVFSTSSSDQTLKRKAQEAWLALKVDNKYSKDQILEFYINKVYMGNNIYGMETASQYYYGKTLKKLSLNELALLAGMPQSPTRYNPYEYPKYAKARRDQVLDSMVKTKSISQETADKYKSFNIKSGLIKNHSKTLTSAKNEKYVDSYLKEVVQELKSKGYKLNSGLKVKTNLNLNLQKQMYKLANNSNSGITFPSNTFQIGATMVNSNNGKIVSMLGNRKTKISFGLNRAVQKDRSNGSTMKPLMDYAPAIEYLKYPTYQMMKDTPFTYPGTNKKLMDFDNSYQGDITMRSALIQSRNIPAIRTLQNVGIGKATNFLSGLGMNFDNTLSLQNGIGGYVSSEQQAAAYAAFANGGTYYKPYMINKVESANGSVKTYSPNGHRAMSESTAFMITDMLKGVMTNPKGSGTSAKINGLHEAGKTGTTQYPNSYLSKVPNGSSMDSWFSGYTKNYSLSVWTGYDQPFKSGNYISSSQTAIAQEYYKYMMQYASINKVNSDWQIPSGVSSTTINGTKEYFIPGYAGEYFRSDSYSNSSTQNNSSRNTTQSSTNNYPKESSSSSSQSSDNSSSESSSLINEDDNDSKNDTQQSTSSNVDQSSSNE
ncbi:carboxypeptidase [Lactobacillus sp. S2-2]|uniref:transglycosylase domain-containing protein n=1 Tax=Lactobacillus sp. S2-2 TaxID=2692917 RepID=UPI001F3BE9E9|nr:transglycosylase domain-containing protein [Lactobacillus sp. S2-2]MCF6515069.1 carboxypeptidase [Lactobacillus sp. S2-2]